MTMKAVIQRVKSASVVVDGEIVGSIGGGLCVLVGISKHATKEDAEWLCRKVLNIKLWSDEKGGSWKKSVMQTDGEVLFISQFTLHSKMKGNKPSFHQAMSSTHSKEFYEEFLQLAKNSYRADKIQDGEFGAMMDVSLINDGPVTIVIESPKDCNNNGIE